MKGIIYFEDGTVFLGKGFGKIGTSVGELVFNTSMTGYQEILTDPSYAGQIITMTYPLIGNYGANEGFNESTMIYAKGMIVKEIEDIPSSYTSETNLNEMMEKMGVVGISGVDTRALTKRIRDTGPIKCVISTEDLSIKELEDYLSSVELVDDTMKHVSTKEVYKIEGTGAKIAVLDFGIKRNILKNLERRNCDITVFPYGTSAEDILATNPDGIFLSNGPGDPMLATEAIEVIKQLIGVKPIFGICMGHQLLALSFGGKTYKMKYGHRGGNHGVYDILRDRAYITSQNHGFAVEKESLMNSDVEITHINLNDDTVEGLRHKTLPIYSVQYHPEGSPGPNDSTYLFDQFITNIEEDIKCQ